LGLAAVWLFVETRSTSATAVSTSPSAPTTVTADEPHAQSVTPATSRPVPPTAQPDASSAPVANVDGDAAHADRVAVVTRMASHKGREKWAPRAEGVLDDIGQHAERVEDRGCYISGCTATYTFASRAAYDATFRDATDSAAYKGWTGGKRWTTPEQQDDGKIIVALLLYRID
jgi:hypothetical protein